MRGGGRAPLALLAAVTVLCWFGAIRSGLDAFQIPSVTSLRFSAPELTASRIQEIRQAQKREAGDTTAFTAYGQLDDQSVRSEEYERAVTCDVLIFDGDVRLILNPRDMNGSFSTSLDARGCALDADTAYRLWGSDNVVGEKLEYQDRDYTVRAVFQDPKGVVMLPAQEPEQTFMAVSLDTRGSDNPTGEAESFRSRYGLAEPETVLSGGWIAGAARLLMLLPALAVGGILCAGMLRELWAIRDTPVLFGLWCVGLAAILLLAGWLSGIRLTFPQSLVPSRWSDFEFWSRTFGDWWSNLRGMLASRRLAPDMVLMETLGKLGLFSATATVSLVMLFRGVGRER